MVKYSLLCNWRHMIQECSGTNMVFKGTDQNEAIWVDPWGSDMY